MRKKTHQEFLAEVNELVGKEYAVLSEYKTAIIKVKIKHNLCNHIYDVSPNAFLNGNRCPLCGDKKRIQTKTNTHEEFINKVKKIIGYEEYKVIGKYVRSDIKIEFYHENCKKIFKMLPKNFLQGKGCPFCAGNIKKDSSRFKNEVKELVGLEYSVLGEYITAKTPIKIKHNLCGYEYEVQPTKFLNNRRCPRCSHREGFEKRTKTHHIFLDEVFNLVGNEYEVIGKYINANTKIEMKHNNCGHKYRVLPPNFISVGARCPKCNASKGETAIANCLKKYNKNYKTQFKFKDCKYKQMLPFDFIVYKKDGSFVLIEYQGGQHYESVEHFGGEKRFRLTQKRDKIKKDYCEKNNIPLIIIPYWDYENIEKILLKKVLG
ncbi:hypothetical protein ACSU64_27885 [Bacillaceae bacterium C204]|uniref:hypothetical protein n=1 Tax=Neobacillus sp. 204 TaxID=3383351 RepID=UPI00397A4630